MITPQELLQEYLDGIEAVDTMKYRKDEKHHHKRLNIIDVNEVNRQRTLFTMAVSILEHTFNNPKFNEKTMYKKHKKSGYYEKL